MTNKPKLIKADTTMQARSTGDYNCIFEITVIKRTAKQATIIDVYKKTVRTKIHSDESGNEYLKPESYARAPIFRAV